MTTRNKNNLAPDSVTIQQWKWSALADMASYLDADSIDALGAGPDLFESSFNLSKTDTGALAAIGFNAIGCALDAIIGGRLGDKLGRKRIYQYDLLVYAAGVPCIAMAVNEAMLFLGTFVVGSPSALLSPRSLAVHQCKPAGITLDRDDLHLLCGGRRHRRYLQPLNYQNAQS